MSIKQLRILWNGFSDENESLFQVEIDKNIYFIYVYSG